MTVNIIYIIHDIIRHITDIFNCRPGELFSFDGMIMWILSRSSSQSFNQVLRKFVKQRTSKKLKKSSVIL